MPRFPKSTWDAVAKSYAVGKTSHALAVEIGASVPAVLYQIRKRGVEIRVTAEMAKLAVKGRHLPDGRKFCPGCNTAKEMANFGLDRSKSDGLHRVCRSCIKERGLRYKLAMTPDGVARRKEYQKKYRNSPNGKARAKINAKKGYTSVAGRFGSCKSAQKRRGKEWAIPRELFAKLILMPCTYCGGPLPTSAAGLDRLDNSKGYTPENVTPCCAICNYARRDQFTVDEMLRHIGPAVRAIRAERAIKK